MKSQPSQVTQPNRTAQEKPTIPDTPIIPKNNTAAKSIKVAGKSALNFSIKNPAGNQAETEKRSTVRSQIKAQTPFSENDLHVAWKKYAGTLQEKVHLKNTMLNNLPVLKDNYEIEVSVFNPQQEEELTGNATSIMEFLRNDLNNASIQMKVSIMEEGAKRVAYTDKEKFDLMSSMNQNLYKLVKEFNLRLD